MTCADKLKDTKASLLIQNITLEEIAAIKEFLRKYRQGKKEGFQSAIAVSASNITPTDRQGKK